MTRTALACGQCLAQLVESRLAAALAHPQHLLQAFVPVRRDVPAMQRGPHAERLHMHEPRRRRAGVLAVEKIARHRPAGGCRCGSGC